MHLFAVCQRKYPTFILCPSLSIPPCPLSFLLCLRHLQTLVMNFGKKKLSKLQEYSHWSDYLALIAFRKSASQFHIVFKQEQLLQPECQWKYSFMDIHKKTFLSCFLSAKIRSSSLKRTPINSIYTWDKFKWGPGKHRELSYYQFNPSSLVLLTPSGTLPSVPHTSISPTNLGHSVHIILL